MTDTSECIVCFEREANMHLKCNHHLCGVCYKKLVKCPLCRFYFKSHHAGIVEYSDDEDAYIDTDEYLADTWVESYHEEFNDLISTLSNGTRLSVRGCNKMCKEFNIFLRRSALYIDESGKARAHKNMREYLNPVLSDEQKDEVMPKFVKVVKELLRCCRYLEKKGETLNFD